MNFYKNYYKILKIEASATREDIKAAYLKLAKQYHPDKHQNSEDSIKLFQEIKEAYDVLFTNKKEYDLKSPHFKKKKVEEQLDIDVVLKLTEAKTCNVQYQAYRGCKKCDQTGFNVNSDFRRCKKCEGRGYDDIDGDECSKCFGTGKTYDAYCPTCRGSKMILTTLNATIESAALVNQISKITIPNIAHRSAKSTNVGNLNISIIWQDKL